MYVLLIIYDQMKITFWLTMETTAMLLVSHLTTSHLMQILDSRIILISSLLCICTEPMSSANRNLKFTRTPGVRFKLHACDDIDTNRFPHSQLTKLQVLMKPGSL